jgi:hypothetical protein
MSSARTARRKAAPTKPTASPPPTAARPRQAAPAKPAPERHVVSEQFEATRLEITRRLAGPVVIERNPNPPPHEAEDRERVYLGRGRPKVDFIVTLGEQVHEVIDVGDEPGSSDGLVRLDIAIAYLLNYFHTEYGDTSEEHAVWNGDGRCPRLLAVLRGLPSGRRAVYLFRDSGVLRRTYPKHRDWAKGRKGGGR